MNQTKEYLGWMSTLNRIVVVMCVWFFAALGSMLYFWVWPKTALGWAVGLFGAPIAFILAEILVGLVAIGFGKVPIVHRAKQNVLDRTKDKTVSSKRTMFILMELTIVAAFLGAIVYGVYRLSGDTFAPVISFFKENFH